MLQIAIFRVDFIYLKTPSTLMLSRPIWEEDDDGNLMTEIDNHRPNMCPGPESDLCSILNDLASGV